MENFLTQHTWLIVLIMIWTLPWKAVALWRSARRAHLGWFIALLVLNTLAILDIVYIFFFSKPKNIIKNREDEMRSPRNSAQGAVRNPLI